MLKFTEIYKMFLLGIDNVLGVATALFIARTPRL